MQRALDSCSLRMFRPRQPALEPEYPLDQEDQPLPTVGLSNRGPRHELAVLGTRKTFADRLVAEAMKQSQPGCLMNMVSAAWVYLFHAVFRHTESVEKENENIRMNLVQQDLAVCAARLNERERELSSRVTALTQEAICRKKAGDLMGARKRLVDRKRVQNQLGQLTNSISVVEMHINTIEGSELNKSILQTLKASGDALRRMGVEGGGIEGVEKIVSEVESQMEYASEITKVISAGNVAGTINSMGGDVYTEEELEQELEDLLLADDDGNGAGAEKTLASQPPKRTASLPPRPEPKKNGVGAALRVPTERTLPEVAQQQQEAGSEEAQEQAAGTSAAPRSSSSSSSRERATVLLI